MTLTRRHAVLFLAIAVWNVVSYANFARNLWESWTGDEERAAGYYVAHVVLVVVNLTIAVVLGRLGLKAWREASAGAAEDVSARR
ncbi:SCO4848 family membrane protein [Nocardioides caldifontis]|uniref:SCO4848 family membrane protein n=1 Tax=Nocardioides caldifontis TaxID=2588938 RepID=UPI0011DF97C2|nr:hypothetical protein [Nocardioides caldifontis]